MHLAPSHGKRRAGEPAWEIAWLFPNQGSWSEAEYFALNTNWRVELSDGFIEVFLPFTTAHQLILGSICTHLYDFVRSRKLGTVLPGPLPVRLWPGKICEPDLVLMMAEHADRMSEEFWRGADLVVEVLSEDAESRRRDLQKNRRDYARARIREYWIIDPEEERILVLRLIKGKYAVHGNFGRGDQATSVLLDGFKVEVDAVLNAK